MIEKDIRMRSIEEMMSGIKQIKFNQLEAFFLKRICLKRKKELRKLFWENICFSTINFFNYVFPILTVVVTVYFWNIKDIGELSLILSSYTTISTCFGMLPEVITQMIIALRSF